MKSSLKIAVNEAKRKVERRLLSDALVRHNWNRKQAARELGISYRAMIYKIKDYRLEWCARQDSNLQPTAS
jgi:two-component system response regulator AtoC